MKSLHLTTAAVAMAGALAMVPVQAQAGTIKFLNVDTLGGSNTFIDVTKLSTNVLSNAGNYTTFVTLGADNLLSNGDTFTESFSLTSVSSIPVSLALSGDYRIDVLLNGAVNNVLGTGISVGAGNVVSGANTTTFDVAFSSATLSLYDNLNNIFISSLSLVSGGAGAIQLVAGQLISPVTLNANIDCTPLCDPYLQDAAGNSLDGTSTLSVTTGSTRFIGFGGTTYNPAGSTLNVNFQDNGSATTFPVPEPTALSLMGLALVGLGFSRRSKKTA